MAESKQDSITIATAAEVCRDVLLGEEAASLLDGQQTPRQFLGLLIERELYTDAARFLARALPKREAVWWACRCARMVSSAAPGPGSSPVAEALDAAERWVADPSEENRRASAEAAGRAGVETPAGCAAMAAFWSGGSLAPPDLPEVPPAEFLTARGVAGAVLLAGVITEPHKAPERYQQYLKLGLAVADGRERWNEAGAKPEPAAKPSPSTRRTSRGRFLDTWE